MARNGKRLRAVYDAIDRDRDYDLEDAIRALKDAKFAKFDETVEIALNLNVDPRHADQMVRGVVNLPHGTGRAVIVAVFARGAKADEAREAGADKVGAEDLAESIQAGQLGFDRCVATPDMMPVVGRLGKILGPRGLMPNPKLGTVTMDVAAAVAAAKAGQVEYRVERTGIIHAGVGKLSFSVEKIAENARALVGAVAKSRPQAIKGTYMKRATLSSTMGPGLHVSTQSLAAS